MTKIRRNLSYIRLSRATILGDQLGLRQPLLLDFDVEIGWGPSQVHLFEGLDQ
jgi:hypothetical protein